LVFRRFQALYLSHVEALGLERAESAFRKVGFPAFFSTFLKVPFP